MPRVPQNVLDARRKEEHEAELWRSAFGRFLLPPPTRAGEVPAPAPTPLVEEEEETAEEGVRSWRFVSDRVEKVERLDPRTRDGTPWEEPEIRWRPIPRGGMLGTWEERMLRRDAQIIHRLKGKRMKLLKQVAGIQRDLRVNEEQLEEWRGRLLRREAEYYAKKAKEKARELAKVEAAQEAALALVHHRALDPPVPGLDDAADLHHLGEGAVELGGGDGREGFGDEGLRDALPLGEDVEDGLLRED